MNLLIAISLFFLLALDLRNIFKLSFSSSIKLIEIFLDLNPFAIGLGLSLSTGILLFSQARKYISKDNWSLIFGVFSSGISLLTASIIQSLFGIEEFVTISPEELD